MSGRCGEGVWKVSGSSTFANMVGTGAGEGTEQSDNTEGVLEISPNIGENEEITRDDGTMSNREKHVETTMPSMSAELQSEKTMTIAGRVAVNKDKIWNHVVVNTNDNKCVVVRGMRCPTQNYDVTRVLSSTKKWAWNSKKTIFEWKYRNVSKLSSSFKYEEGVPLQKTTPTRSRVEDFGQII